MTASDKVEAVQKSVDTQSKQSMNPIEEMEHMSSNKEHFQSLLDSSQPIKNKSFERIDNKAFATEEAHSLDDKKSVFGDENVSSQKSSSGTDQDRKNKKQPAEEIGNIEEARQKKPSNASKSLMNDVGQLNTNVSKMAQLSPETIKNQAKDIVSQFEQVKTKLSQAQGDIKPSYHTLLRNRLAHIDDNVKIALNKAGVEYTSAPQATSTQNANPIQQFIRMMSNSQQQMENMHTTLEQLHLTGQQISGPNMLAIQIKINYIQQQIELFTSLLNKALESTKTLMNVQV